MLDDRGMRGSLRSVSGAPATALAIAIYGCAVTSSAPTNVDPQAALASDQAVGGDRGVGGVWQGISLSNCESDHSDPGRCMAEQKIILTMFQHGNEVTGFYKCAYGNQVCRHLNETGVIRNGTLNHMRLMMRVLHEDGSMCFFTGRPAGNQLNGGYECLQGGGIIEQGTFQTRRNY